MTTTMPILSTANNSNSNINNRSQHVRPRHRRRTRNNKLAVLTITSCLCLLAISTNGETSSTIPRSTNRYSSPNSVDTISNPSSSSSSGSTSSSNSDPPLPPQTGQHHPPWNPSPKIDPRTGFLSELYPRLPGEWEPLANIRGRYGPRSKSYSTHLSRHPVRIRQVPGDGNCLFHSLSACLGHVTNGTHVDMGSPESIWRLRCKSLELRNAAVDILQGGSNNNNNNNYINSNNSNNNNNNHNKYNNPRRKLFLQGEEYLEARELLAAAAAQFQLGGDEYCELMRKESYWGGGPEIVALCNYLQRPIHIYELIPTSTAQSSSSFTSTSSSSSSSSSTSSNNNQIQNQHHPTSTQFTLRRMACFGSPKFDRREALHILSADSRFPDIDPRKIRKVGNHFLALFPVSMAELRDKGKKQNSFWWGGGSGVGGDDGGSDEDGGERKHALVRGGCGKRRRLLGSSSSSNSDDDVDGNDEERKSGSHTTDESTRLNERWDGGIGKWTNKVVDWISSGGGSYGDNDYYDDNEYDNGNVFAIEGMEEEDYYEEEDGWFDADDSPDNAKCDNYPRIRRHGLRHSLFGVLSVRPHLRWLLGSRDMR